MEQVLISRKITLYFTLLSALFVALSSQFLSFVFSLIFIIPIYMAIGGLKHRRKSGFLIGMSIPPLALTISIMWIKYFLSIANDIPKEAARISVITRASASAAQIFMLLVFILSIIMLVLSIIVFVKLLLNRKMYD